MTVNTFLALLTGGGIAAAGGLLSGWLNNWLGGKRDQRTQDHDQELAREARRQARLEQTYMDLGMYLSRHDDWVRSVRPYKRSYPAPPPVAAEERWRVLTAVKMYGSDEVQRLLDVWGRESGSLQHADEVISRAENAAGSDPELERAAEAERCEIEE